MRWSPLCTDVNKGLGELGRSGICFAQEAAILPLLLEFCNQIKILYIPGVEIPAVELKIMTPGHNKFTLFAKQKKARRGRDTPAGQWALRDGGQRAFCRSCFSFAM